MFGLNRPRRHQLTELIADLIEAQALDDSDRRRAPTTCDLPGLATPAIPPADDSPLAMTKPTEAATGAMFAYTAIVAGKPGNCAALEEAGRLYGRVAQLLDAVEDLPGDTANEMWNLLTSSGTTVAEARRLCADAALGIELALADVEFTHGRRIRRLLTEELRRSVDRTFHPASIARRHAAAEKNARQSSTAPSTEDPVRNDTDDETGGIVHRGGIEG